MLKRIICWIVRGHEWSHAYARGYDGCEVMHSRCRCCGATARTVVR